MQENCYWTNVIVAAAVKTLKNLYHIHSYIQLNLHCILNNATRFTIDVGNIKQTLKRFEGSTLELLKMNDIGVSTKFWNYNFLFYLEYDSNYS